MPGLTDFHFGATVVSTEGRNVGTLKSVVVDQDGFDAHALVIKEEEPLAARLLGAESLTVRDELVVPIAAVEAASHDQIRLRIRVREVRHQRPYLSYHLRPLSSEDAFRQVLALGTSTPNLPDLEERADKAAGDIEIEQDENVMLGKTGRKLGHVKDVLYDQGELVGVVLSPAGFFKQDLVLPVRFLDRSDDLALFAHLEESDLERLQPFRESPA